MAIPSSQSTISESHEMAELRPLMPVDLFMAAIEGSWDLTRRLGLELEKPTETHEVTTETSHSAPEQIQKEHQTVQSELQSAMGLGDTVLHLLVTNWHNKLALMVFERDRSLLNAHNKMLETPLHCAAKVGNGAFIDNLSLIDPVIVKDAIKEIDKNGDTPLHIAAKHGHVDVGRVLMTLDPEVALRVNKEMICPLYIAIVKKYTKLVQTMLELVPTLACIPVSDGMFPVHVSARTGNIKLVIHFIKRYPNYAKLQDSCGRNLFHIAAEENHKKIFTDVFKDTKMGDMIARMNNARDNEGNTPLHIAAMKGHKSIMKAIWEKKMGIDAERMQNNEGLTPFELFVRQLETNEYIDGSRFTQEWFDDVMQPAPTDKWERTQVIGLGSVLITTIAFAAAFTIPGGYNQANGTPVLGRRYIFRAFIIANGLAFMQGFISLMVLLTGTPKFYNRSQFAVTSFTLAASSMVVAFGLGMYVTLASVCYPIAVLFLVIALFIGSPIGLGSSILYGPTMMKFILARTRSKLQKTTFVLVLWTMSFVLIFCPALL